MLEKGLVVVIVSIDECSSKPLYKQIHDQIVAGIAMGELEPGMSLPSVRSLASDLGINLHTVNKAYAVLRDEGYVQMRGRAGAVISEPSDASRADKNRRSLEEVEGDLFKLALIYRACGGTRGQFLECAAAQAARAYGAVGVDKREDASAKRSKKRCARTSGNAAKCATGGLSADASAQGA